MVTKLTNCLVLVNISINTVNSLFTIILIQFIKLTLIKMFTFRNYIQIRSIIVLGYYCGMNMISRMSTISLSSTSWADI